MSRRSSLLTTALGGLIGTALMLAGCTSGTVSGSSGTVNLSSPRPGHQGGGATTPATSTSITPTPVTPDGLLTGPGVTDTTLTLGLLIDPTVDRGFSTGVALWQHAVNTSGGICGRTIDIATHPPVESLATAYRRIAGTALGLITLPGQAGTIPMSALSSADQMPTLTLAGSSADLSRTGPVVVGATEDIKAINALAYLRSIGRLPRGSTLGTVTDSSADGADALAGARWWGARNGVGLAVRTVGDSTTGQSSWTGVGAILVTAGVTEVRAALAASPAHVDVITNLDGYDPAQIPAPAGRLLVSLAAPAYGSDNPGAAAVARAFVASGRSNPGPDLMSGYGVAATWGRLLTRACAEKALTRTGVRTAMTTVGPASVDSLFGPSDPGLIVGSALPATRVSSVALADPKAPAGLRPLTWLQAAPGIGEYVPGK